jgi:hypothetical protein
VTAETPLSLRAVFSPPRPQEFQWKIARRSVKNRGAREPEPSLDVAYLQTCAVAVLVNDVVDVTFPEVTTDVT